VVKPFVRELERGYNDEREEGKRRERRSSGSAKRGKEVLDMVKFSGDVPYAFRGDKSTDREL
jgi:hypothetical protein